MRRMALPAIVLLLLLQFFCRCTDSSSNETAQAPALETESGTAEMVRLLRESYARIDISRNTYASNSLRAEQFRTKMLNSTDLGERLTNNIYYAYELLSAGKNEQAVGEFEKLLQTAQKAGVGPDFIDQIKRMLALSYVRIGDTSNWLERFNAESCLMHIQDRGVYAIRAASERAVELYEELLM